MNQRIGLARAYVVLAVALRYDEPLRAKMYLNKAVKIVNDYKSEFEYPEVA